VRRSFIAGLVLIAVGVAFLAASASATGQNSSSDKKSDKSTTFNDCGAGFERVAPKSNTSITSVGSGIKEGCASWDCPDGFRTISPYKDGSDAVFIANQSYQDREDDDIEGCTADTGSEPSPRSYEQDDEDQNWWSGHGPRVDAIVGNIVLPPATPKSEPVTVKFTDDSYKPPTSPKSNKPRNAGVLFVGSGAVLTLSGGRRRGRSTA
jgi:hypothetical protein